MRVFRALAKTPVRAGGKSFGIDSLRIEPNNLLHIFMSHFNFLNKY